MSAIVTRDLIVAHTRALKLPGVARVFESLARQVQIPAHRERRFRSNVNADSDRC